MHVLVYGYYGKGNLGDELFKEAFTRLFPDWTFVFVDHFRVAQLAQTDAVIIGGGSLLDGPLSIDLDAWPALEAAPLLYMGVGGETEVHPDHVRLMQRALGVITRDSTRTPTNAPTLVAPDLVYALRYPLAPQRRKKSVLVVPNTLVVPTAGDAHWRYASWAYAKSEMAQALDVLVDEGHEVSFYAMSRNPRLHDDWAATEILTEMRHRNAGMISREIAETAEQAVHLFSRYGAVITQRYHGHVLADLAGTPCVTVHHHDKLKVTGAISYWGLTKDALLAAFKNAQVGVVPSGHDEAVRLVRGAFDGLCRGA